jgi:hypothetical protein
LWITDELFFQWPLHFIKIAKPSKDEPASMKGTPIKNQL